MTSAASAEMAPAQIGLTDLKEENLNEKNLQDVQVGNLISYDPNDPQNKKVLRKIDIVILPLMGFCYMLQYMDKLAISQSTLLGMRADIGLVGSQYSWCSAIFYFGYLFWSWPTSYLIVKFPLAKYLSVTVFLWGGILMCHGAVNNFAGMMTTRFFLGVAEAAVAPGFALITGMFYTRKEQPARQGAWFAGNSVANIIGGVIAYGIGKITTSHLETWRLLFIILGSVTSGYAFLLFLILPDSPTTAVFLNKPQREIALSRTLANKTGVLDNRLFKWKQVGEACKDPQMWLLVLYNISVMIANGGLTSFGAIVVAGFGFSDLKALLIQMPLGVSQLVFLIITSVLGSLLPQSRIFLMIFNTLTSMVGMILVYQLEGKAGRMAGLCLAAVFAVNIPLALSLISSNVAGFTKRATVSAAMFAAYCIGNIIGPQFFLASQEPKYDTGLRASLAGFAFGTAFLIVLYFYYVWENRRRDRLYGSAEQVSADQELSDELSNKTDMEITSFRYVL